MIKTKHALATSVNQPKIISLEHSRKSGRGGIKSENPNICLNCSKAKCNGTKHCYEERSAKYGS